MKLFYCTYCVGEILVNEDISVTACPCCNERQAVPKNLDITLEKLYEEASNLRIAKKFDRAIAIYDQIIIRDKTQSEAYWGRILCKYGIEYIDDTTKNKKVPTCHIAIFDTVVNDEDYKKTFQYADEEQRVVYEKAAKEIDRIHKEILELARKGENYDVFICYKQTDEKGKRTRDSFLAEKIYNRLSKKGIKVFFAHITLQDKLGEKYEPIIFSALNSAKVMIVVGTKPEYLNSVWVKNEWSRYLKIIQSGTSKYLIPCFCDMSANDLPEELRSLQAKDMSDIAFELEDLEKVVEKRLGKDKEPIPPVPPIEKAKDVTIEEPKKPKKIAKVAISLVALALLLAIFFTVVLPIIQNRRGDTVPQPDMQDFIEATDKQTNANNSTNSETETPNNVDNNTSNGGEIDLENNENTSNGGEIDSGNDENTSNDDEIDSGNDENISNDDEIDSGNNENNSNGDESDSDNGNEDSSSGSENESGGENDDVLIDPALAPFEVVTNGNSCTITGLKDKTITNIIIPESVTEIGNKAFANCNNISTVVISNGIKNICDEAFSSCSGLTTVTISNSVTNIGYRAFYGCTALKGIAIPNSVTDIGNQAFYSCIELASVKLSNCISNIGDSTFYGCSKLASITIPSSVTSIGNSAFFGCDNLTSVVLETTLGWYYASSSDATSGTDFSANDLANKETAATYLTDTYGDKYWHWRHICVDDNNDGKCDGCQIRLYSVGLEYELNSNGNAYSVKKIGTCTDTDVIIPSKYNDLPVIGIGDSAFNWCSNLTSITIPNSVTSIGNDAFYECASLKSITIPNSVTSIGERAFLLCKNLTSITIPNSVTSIGVWTFSYCENLTSITIPNSITSIKDGMFYDCTNLTSITIPNSVTIIELEAFSGCKNLTSITIPNSVTVISAWAFYGCENLTNILVDDDNLKFKSINGNVYTKDEKTIVCYAPGKKDENFIIPNSVTNIGRYAFMTCTNLTGIAIPNSVTSIGDGAFDDCENLTSIIIPNSVTSIGAVAFRDCSNITSIIIPNSVTSIGKNAFEDCSNLTSVEFETILDWYYSSSSDATSGTYISANDLANKETAATYLTDTYVDQYWYWKEHVCVDGDKDKICDRCQTIFYSIGLEYELNYSENTYSVKGIGTCTDTDVSIPPKYNSLPVTSIGKSAFYSCSNLTSITIPNSVTSIGSRAFSSCSNLTSITIPNSVTSIGTNPFVSCSNLTNISVDKNNTKYKSIDGNVYTKDEKNLVCYAVGKTDKSFTIPNGVISIGISAFDSCYDLETIIVPDSVINIADYAFSECNNLENIVIPNSVTSIGIGAFSYCYSLDSISIPNSVTSISDYMFYDSTNLTSITIPNSITRIGEKAFYDVWGLENIIIPSSVVSIGKQAFLGCNYVDSKNVIFENTIGWSEGSIIISPDELADPSTAGLYLMDWHCGEWTCSLTDDTEIYALDEAVLAPFKYTTNGIDYEITGLKDKTLTDIVIPKGVTSIGWSAFEDCSNLTSITIPDSVTSIGYGAFNGCSNLTSITIPNSVTSIGDWAFEECSNLTSITIPNSVTSIGGGAFSCCSKLTNISVDVNNTKYKSINGNVYTKDEKTLVCYAVGKTDKSFTIPNSVTSIGESAFYSCENLTSITIPNSVTSIGSYAFSSCKNLTSITIPNSVTSIGSYAFSSCKNLTSITIPNSVTSIGDYAFYSCENLTSITIPNSVTSIGDRAFYDCSNLTSITIPNSVTSIGSYAFYECSNLISVTFENTNGWSVGSTSISSVDLSNPSTAAVYLTDKYSSFLYSWSRSRTN